VPDRIVVLGMIGDTPVDATGYALVVGSARHLECARTDGPTVVLGALEPALDAVAAARGTACVLASGDPGFFGIVRCLAARFGSGMLDVRPAPSSVSLAFARLGLAWDDALVVSAHGRPLADAAGLAAAGAAKVAILCGPDAPPDVVVKAVVDAGGRFDRVAVCSRLGERGETVVVATPEEIATFPHDPLAVVVLVRGDGIASEAVRAWARPEGAYLHRGGLITKSEVRAVVLARLALPGRGVLWDVGAGSGSVGIESALLAPGLSVYAVERRVDDCARIASNAAGAQVAVDVVCGDAPAVFAVLPAPDRAFIGGGGIDVLDAVLAQLRPGGRAVATYAALDRAVAAYERLGSMVQVGVARAEPLAGGVRLVANDPVFVAWGPARSEP
jgi:precorrin-6Y C5,15-methyltransferase (decarboxylating)